MTVSNDFTDDARADANQRDRPAGLVSMLDERISIWAKSWGQIIQDCEGRLNFFKGKLEYEADQDSAVSYLRKAHAKYLPKTSEFEDEPDLEFEG